MAQKTSIEWTDATWSPVLGCSPASRGCDGCYAVRTVWRMAHNPNPKVAEPRAGLVEKTSAGVLRWTGQVRCLPDQLEVPLGWKEPRRIFVANQSDLFHPGVPDEFIDRVFEVMQTARQHTYQILTKRPERMRRFLSERVSVPAMTGPFPTMARHIWLGVSVEDQPAADSRIPHLLATPAAVRFLSCEPLLGPVDLKSWTRKPGPIWEHGDRSLDWVIVGSESGPRARPMDEDWVRSLRDQCQPGGVAFFYKQRLDGKRVVGLPELDGRVWKEFPRG